MNLPILFLSFYIQMIKSYTIFYDSMDNAVATGWSFSKYTSTGHCGNIDWYFSPTNSTSCPTGGYCTRLRNTKMTKTFTGIGALTSLQIKYDVRGWRDVLYKYNNQASWVDLFPVNEGTNIMTLAEPTGATSVQIQLISHCWEMNSSPYYVTGDGYWDNFYLMATSSAPTKSTKSPTKSPTKPPTKSTKSPTKSPTYSPTTEFEVFTYLDWFRR
eukprot:103646_1